MEEIVKTDKIASGIDTLPLIASGIVLVYAILRLDRLSKSTSKRMINKVMVTMIIFNYLLVIIIDILTSYIPTTDSRAYEISNICYMAIISMTSLIFGLILY